MPWQVFAGVQTLRANAGPRSLPGAREPDVQALLSIPAHVAVCAIMPLGRPVRMLSRLTRRTVAEFARHERWDGRPFGR